jgi:sugar phosphate permease
MDLPEANAARIAPHRRTRSNSDSNWAVESNATTCEYDLSMKSDLEPLLGTGVKGHPPGQRGIMILILFFCNCCLYINRANISVAIVYMYKDKGTCDVLEGPFGFHGGKDGFNAYTRHDSDFKEHKNVWCQGKQGHTPLMETDVDLDYCKAKCNRLKCTCMDFKVDNKSHEAALILSAFYWGYMLSQIPAGWMASKYGGKIVLSVAVVAWSFATLIAWPAFKMGVGMMVLSRVVVGIAEGANYPSQICLNANWIPMAERSRAWAFITSGESLGTIAALAGCPFLTHAFGWQSIFWVSGIMGLVWLTFFWLFVSSTPDTHPRISAEELAYIRKSVGQVVPPTDVPWGSFMKSSAFWGLIVTHFCYNWGTYVIASWLPKYFSSMFNVDYKALGK